MIDLDYVKFAEDTWVTLSTSPSKIQTGNIPESFLGMRQSTECNQNTNNVTAQTQHK